MQAGGGWLDEGTSPDGRWRGIHKDPMSPTEGGGHGEVLWLTAVVVMTAVGFTWEDIGCPCRQEKETEGRMRVLQQDVKVKACSSSARNPCRKRRSDSSPLLSAC